jgi:hypothetical protein
MRRGPPDVSTFRRNGALAADVKAYIIAGDSLFPMNSESGSGIVPERAFDIPPFVGLMMRSGSFFN